MSNQSPSLPADAITNPFSTASDRDLQFYIMQLEPGSAEYQQACTEQDARTAAAHIQAQNEDRARAGATIFHLVR